MYLVCPSSLRSYSYTSNHPLILESTRPEREVAGTTRAVVGLPDARTIFGGFFWGGASIFGCKNSSGLFFPAPDFELDMVFFWFKFFQISNKDDKTR